MPFPSFYGSLLIASSATATLLFAILTYIYKTYKSSLLNVLLFLSLLFTVATNACLVIAFYQYELAGNSNYPLYYPSLTFFIAMLFLAIAALYALMSNFAKTL